MSHDTCTAHVIHVASCSHVLIKFKESEASDKEVLDDGYSVTIDSRGREVYVIYGLR